MTSAAAIVAGLRPGPSDPASNATRASDDSVAAKSSMVNFPAGYSATIVKPMSRRVERPGSHGSTQVDGRASTAAMDVRTALR